MMLSQTSAKMPGSYLPLRADAGSSTWAVMAPTARGTTKVVPDPVAMTRPARRSLTLDEADATVTTRRVPLRFTLMTRSGR